MRRIGFFQPIAPTLLVASSQADNNKRQTAFLQGGPKSKPHNIIKIPY